MILRRVAMCLLSFWLMSSASAQTIIEPAASVAIENLIVDGQGFATVVFADSIPLLDQVCTTLPVNGQTQQLVGRRFIYVRLTTPSGKQMYNSLVIAQQLGRKVKGFSVTNPTGGWCEMYSVRTEP